MQRLPQFNPQYKTTPLTLQERDFQLLNTVYEYRFIDAEQLRALFAPSVKDPVVQGAKTNQAITRRLNDLFHHGYLTRPKAQLALRERYGIELPMSKAQERGTADVHDRHLLHTLMVSTFRATLERALADSLTVALALWKREYDLKTKTLAIDYPVGLQGKRKRESVPVRPDAFFTLKLITRPEPNTLNFFLEADRSTMRHAEFSKKALGYLAYYKAREHTKAYGIQEFRVLTITPTHERRDNLRATVADTLNRAHITGKDTRRFLFACERDYALNRPATLLAALWYDLNSQHPTALLPSTTQKES